MSTKRTNGSGQFSKGTSGNPSGRAPGSRNQATLLMESLLEGEAEQLNRKALELGVADTLNPACSRERTADLPGDGEGVRGNQRRRDHAYRRRGGLEHLGNPQGCPGGTGLRTAVGRLGAKDVQRWDGAQPNAWPGN